MTFSDAKEAFCALASTPYAVDQCLELLERYVVLLYDHTSSLTAVNQARKELFTHKGRSIEGLPPTQAALIEQQHTNLVTAGYR